MRRSVPCSQHGDVSQEDTTPRGWQLIQTETLPIEVRRNRRRGTLAVLGHSDGGRLFRIWTQGAISGDSLTEAEQPSCHRPVSTDEAPVNAARIARISLIFQLFRMVPRGG